MPSPTKLRELGSYIREQRKRGEYSLRHLAKVAGVSNPYLSQIERGLRKPSAEILQAIAKALQISAESLYIKAGILEEREELADLEVAILRDAWLSERQRAALLEIYRSFRHENEEWRATKKMGWQDAMDAVEPVPPRSQDRDFELAEDESSPGERSATTGPERQISPT
ncbi:MAG: helix-turn-helix domain-containing protein [Actinomycetota bacterium]|nr:helix-turn-helix domain-containing protein [Actinomycetota bacterium]